MNLKNVDIKMYDSTTLYVMDANSVMITKEGERIA